MWKREHKYLVPKGLIDVIRSEMRPYVSLDKHSANQEEKQYTVRSIYYDTRRFSCYDEKIEGLKTKKKFRVRGYNTREEDSIAFMEIKRKSEDLVEKDRSPFKWDRVKALLSGNGLDTQRILSEKNPGEDEGARRFLYNYHQKKLLPTVLVIYEREAFYSKFDPSFRVTFDKNVRSLLYPSIDSLYVTENVKYCLPHHFIFEVKFYRGSLPFWIRAIMLTHQLQRLSISKYTLCIDSHRAAEKFARSLAHVPL